MSDISTIQSNLDACKASGKWNQEVQQLVLQIVTQLNNGIQYAQESGVTDNQIFGLIEMRTQLTSAVQEPNATVNQKQPETV